MHDPSNFLGLDPEGSSLTCISRTSGPASVEQRSQHVSSEVPLFVGFPVNPKKRSLRHQPRSVRMLARESWQHYDPFFRPAARRIKQRLGGMFRRGVAPSEDRHVVHNKGSIDKTPARSPRSQSTLRAAFSSCRRTFRSPAENPARQLVQVLLLAASKRWPAPPSGCFPRFGNFFKPLSQGPLGFPLSRPTVFFVLPFQLLRRSQPRGHERGLPTAGPPAGGWWPRGGAGEDLALPGALGQGPGLPRTRRPDPGMTKGGVCRDAQHLVP